MRRPVRRAAPLGAHQHGWVLAAQEPASPAWRLPRGLVTGWEHAWAGAAAALKQHADMAHMRLPECGGAGVMALTPSSELFNAMMASIATTPSYTGGDQGFLNALFAGGVRSAAGRGSSVVRATVSMWPLASRLLSSTTWQVKFQVVAGPATRLILKLYLELKMVPPPVLPADWAAAPRFDPRQGRLLSASSGWRTSTPAAKGLPVRAVLPAARLLPTCLGAAKSSHLAAALGCCMLLQLLYLPCCGCLHLTSLARPPHPPSAAGAAAHYLQRRPGPLGGQLLPLDAASR